MAEGLAKKSKSKVFLKALTDIEDEANWPIASQFENAFQVPIDFVEEQPRAPSNKRRKSDSAAKPERETKKRRATVTGAEEEPKKGLSVLTSHSKRSSVAVTNETTNVFTTKGPLHCTTY
jgi:hypothetical protein